MLIDTIGAAVLLAGAPVALAAPGLASSTSVATTAQGSVSANPMQAFINALYRREFAAALNVVDQVPPPAAAEGRGLLSAMRGAALVGLKRLPEARRAFADAQRLAPNEPLISTLQFEAGVLTNESAIGVDGLDRIIARFPDQIHQLDEDMVWYLLYRLPEGQARANDDRRLALAQAGFGGETGDPLTKMAILILIQRGDARAAVDLLRYVDDPVAIEDMLIQRRYAAIWPQLEAHAGPHLDKVRASSVTAARAAWEREPDDEHALQDYINSLRRAGRFDEAIALRTRGPSTKEQMASVGEEMGWAVNNVALALHEAGRADEADALFAMLNETLSPERGWLIGMIVNRLELLVADGRFERAAVLLDLAEKSARDDGNAYAQQLVRRIQYCTLTGLGRQDAARTLLPDLLSHAKDAYGPTIDALLCAGNVDQAEAVTMAAINDENFIEQFVRGFQPVRLTAGDPSVWQDRWTELRNRPAVARAFARLGRAMPAEFLPLRRSMQ